MEKRKREKGSDEKRKRNIKDKERDQKKERIAEETKIL